jgi:hypothetical protein
MSDAEQDAALLRLVKERSEAKRRKNLLESELSAAGRTFSAIGDALKLLDAPNVITAGTPDHVLREIDKAPEICELNSIKRMISELKVLRTRLGDLDRRAAQLGVD